MNVFSGKKIACFCAFCRSTKKVYSKKRVNLFNVIASFTFAGVITFLIFQNWHPLSLLLFVGFLGLTEITLQMRWRISLVCKKCGFDPVMYLKNVDAAIEKVQKRLAERKDDPAAWMGTPLNIPTRRKEKIPDWRSPARAATAQPPAPAHHSSRVSKRI